MQHLVKPVKHLEQRRLAPARPLGEHHAAVEQCAATRHELHRVLGPVLAVRVHHEQRVARQMFLHVGRAERDGALVADVAPQPQDFDARARGQLELLRQRHRRAVVHQQHAQRHVCEREGPVEVSEQVGRRRRVIMHGRDHDHLIGKSSIAHSTAQRERTITGGA